LVAPTAGIMVRPTFPDLAVQLPAAVDGLEHPPVRSLMALLRYAAGVRTLPGGRATAMVEGTTVKIGSMRKALAAAMLAGLEGRTAAEVLAARLGRHQRGVGTGQRRLQ